MFGYDHDAFWDQTPHTLSLTFEAYNDLQIDRHNARAWLAWHVAGLQRTSRFPPLKKMLQTKRKPVALEDQLEGLKHWVQAAGGKIIYKQ